MSCPDKLIGVFFEYNRGAVMSFSVMSIGIGHVTGIICVFREKPTVSTDDPDRGNLEPAFPMQE